MLCVPNIVLVNSHKIYRKTKTRRKRQETKKSLLGVVLEFTFSFKKYLLSLRFEAWLKRKSTREKKKIVFLFNRKDNNKKRESRENMRKTNLKHSRNAGLLATHEL